MKLSELIKEIEALGKSIYIDWCKAESGFYCKVEREAINGATRLFPIQYLHLIGNNFNCKVVMDKDLKETFCRVADDLKKFGFIDDLSEWKKKKESDVVNHPSHYTQGKVECIDAIESATINKKGVEAICVANIIKYLWRYEAKNGLEDVKKARWYIQKLIEKLEKLEKK